MAPFKLVRRQVWALMRKNLIILRRHWLVNFIRCLLLPIGYAAFFAKAQDFFTSGAVLGLGSAVPIQSIPADLLSRKLLWSPPTNALSPTSFVDELMERVITTNSITGRVQKVDTATAIDDQCPQNFQARSECFAAVVFEAVDNSTGMLTYKIRGDLGLNKVDVEANSGDIETRFLPLQWAIDSTFMEMRTGVRPPTPAERPYTNRSQAQLDRSNNRLYLNGIRSLIGLAFFLVFLGVVYQLPGGIASERAMQLTSHLEAMGCSKTARILSWHISLSLTYLPAWIIIAVIWKLFIFKQTSVAIILLLYVLTGLSLASWTFLVAAPFGSAPTLAAIVSVFLAIIFAIIAQILKPSTGPTLILCVIFPPMIYINQGKIVAAFELADRGASLLNRPPGGGPPLLALVIVAIIDIILFPFLAAWVERSLYGVRRPDQSSKKHWWKASSKSRDTQVQSDPVPDNVAVRLTNFTKSYTTRRFGIFGRSKPVVAVQDLSLSVPKGEIFCLLGRNGAAKSTTLGVIGQLVSSSGGLVEYRGGSRPRLGIAPQKNVLWDELTCQQHVRLWRAMKTRPGDVDIETDAELLGRCDLAHKRDQLSTSLSGGQKRKLQLAIALVGGSDLLLLDEISSGLDPLSRRAIWKVVVANRGRTTTILTTHFLDEADILGDHIAIMKAPGQLLALDSPVALKSQLGKGYTIKIVSPNNHQVRTFANQLLKPMSAIHSGTTIQSITADEAVFALGSQDTQLISRLLQALERERALHGNSFSYECSSASLEEVFLELNADARALPEDVIIDEKKAEVPVTATMIEAEASRSSSTLDTKVLSLTSGRRRGVIRGTISQALVIVHKRVLVLRRSWILPVIAVLIACLGACIPLFFMKDRVQTCERQTRQATNIPLTYPLSFFPLAFDQPVSAPQGIFESLTPYTISTTSLDSGAAFDQYFTENYRNQSFGGVYLPADESSRSEIAHEASALRYKGLSLLNLLTNTLYNRALTASDSATNTGFHINMSYEAFAGADFSSIGSAIKWMAFFGLAMAVWPAFSTIYVTAENASTVRSNQYSNGATPVGLWLGHLLFELPGIFLVSIVITVVFATVSSQFNGIGELFACFILYGISSTLYAFCFSLFLTSQLAAWALYAGISVILFLLYLASYLLILTYDKSSASADHITITHFTVGLISPVPNIVRAGLVSTNLFSLLCDGLGSRKSEPYSDINQFGGPILYMILQACLAFAVLVYVDSGAPRPRLNFLRRRKGQVSSVPARSDVTEEKDRVEKSGDVLRVVSLTKRFKSSDLLAVDDVTFGVAEGTNFALIGPNGAGKTTTLGCIRGVVRPTSGEIQVDGHSLQNHRNLARSALGVCAQTNAIDSALTVRQHVWIYGRLKGVPSNALKTDVDVLLKASGLDKYHDRFASKLSGGNQRKLCLAIALIGNPPVLLVDEFSSGVDPFSKREAWTTLADLTKDRAVVMTTHSMEEVDALSSRVGIIASKLLAIGTPSSLRARYNTYECNVPASRLEECFERVKEVYPDATRSVDTASRFEVPASGGLSRLFDVLAQIERELSISEISVSPLSIESVFLAMVREHNIEEEDSGVAQNVKKRHWWSRSS